MHPSNRLLITLYLLVVSIILTVILISVTSLAN
jgi:hypothetical protein